VSPQRIDVLTAGACVIAVLAVSTSGPLAAGLAVPALAIAFWRTALAVGVLLPVTAVRRRGEFVGLDWAGRRRIAASGAFLAAHFATWIPSLTMTTVATATALVCTTPVWTALISARSGKPVPRAAWIGILVAVGGVAVMTGVDISVSGRAVVGDVMALASAALVAGYTTLGERVRADVSTTLYSTLCYSMCAVLLFAVCLVGGVRLTGYDARSWLGLAAMTIGPQLLGHSLFNRVLGRLSATAVSLIVLFEVPGAALIAWAALGQSPPAFAWFGILVLLGGLAVVVVALRRRTEIVDPAVTA
jgi:drug/metabolite transporter (DMT)-like permease